MAMDIQLVYLLLLFLLRFAGSAAKAKDEPQADTAAGLQRVAQCRAKYGKRSFVPLERAMQNYPPVLLSFPGAGNTWLRTLVEYATGYYSGSIDVDDDQLKAILKGESSCGMRMCIIKGHPHDLVLKQERGKPSGWVYRIRFNKKNQRKKCNRGLVQYFRRVLMLVRHPLDAILAEFQRAVTGQHTGALTVAHITENATDWRAASLQQALHYSDKMDKMIHPLFLHYPHRDVATVHFEDLADRASGVATLRGVVSFLNYSHISDDRLHCAFLLAEGEKVRRKKEITTSYAFREKTHYCAVSVLLATFLGNFSYGPRPKNSSLDTNCS